MKKTLVLILAVLAATGAAFAQAAPPVVQGKVSLSGAWALYPMAVKWAEEFRKIHPQVQIDVQAGGAGKGLTDALTGMVDIGLVSRDIQPAEVAKGAFPLAVTKDGVVATISAKNPLMAAIKSKGLTRAAFIDIWITGKPLTWGQALGTPDKQPVRVFTRSDACGAAETWAAFLGKRQEDLGGVGVYGDPGLADAARRDPLAIGYNNINFAYDAKTLKPIEGLEIVPIDLDGNGRIDPAESIYATRDDITTAIAGNKYPSPPARDLYFVTKGKPANPAVVAFIKWVLAEGQAFVPETGYIPLAKDKLAAGLARLTGK
ncbi:MAG: substrate-binding domain-containing protein [Candidatus Aminicenantes bacterium]|nr:substrate-binding domain-containing protein [Candidatus Aminicenantes bacterium]